MNEKKEIGISVNVEGIENATKAMNRLAEALERTKKAINSLNGIHGGVSFQMIGEVVNCEIRSPVIETADGEEIEIAVGETLQSIKSGARMSKGKFSL